MERVVQRFASFAAADEADWEYYQRLTPAERLQVVFALMFPDDAPAEGFARVYRVVPLARG